MYQSLRSRTKLAQVIAQLNFLHIAPRKVRSVVKVLKGMDVEKARYQLIYILRRPKDPLIKLLNSAIANAKNNFSMVEDNLFIKEILVNEGIKLKRFRPSGFGKAAPIQKKTSHVKIVLEERKPGLKMAKSEKIKEAKEEITAGPDKKTEKKSFDKTQEKPEIKKEIGKKGVFSGVKDASRKFFRRKSI